MKTRASSIHASRTDAASAHHAQPACLAGMTLNSSAFNSLPSPNQQGRLTCPCQHCPLTSPWMTLNSSAFAQTRQDKNRQARATDVPYTARPPHPG
eukprot:361546-Chlamydomonas_euryale.AAC.2